jgi:formylglycine-generating enzyme required for sulfatase activity
VIIWCNAYSEMSGKVPYYYYMNTVIKDSTNSSVCLKVEVGPAGVSNYGYFLPSEAWWEYAARGGGPAVQAEPFLYKYAGSNTVTDVAWCKANAYNVGSGHPDYGTHPVGTKAPNTIGLFDMSGNVEEWSGSLYSST